MSEKPEKFYSKGAEQFAETYSIENMPQAYIDLLDRFAEKVNNGKVLDAGCGHGRDTEYLTEEGLDVIGVDLAEGMIEHAKENKKGKFQKMDVRDLEFDDNEFEGLWCNTVMHFFPPEEMPEVLDELKRVLKPEGILYITFKIGTGSIDRKEYGSEVKQYLIPEEKAKNMLNEKGFRITSIETSEVNGTPLINVIAKVEE